MCYSSLYIASRDASAKEHLKLGKRSHHVVPVPVKKEPENKMVCIRQKTAVVIKKFELNKEMLRHFKAQSEQEYAATMLKLHGKTNVKATMDQTQRFTFTVEGKPYYVYWSYCQTGMLFDIGYPVRKRRVKKPAVTTTQRVSGKAGMKAVKAALTEASKLPTVKVKTVKA